MKNNPFFTLLLFCSFVISQEGEIIPLSQKVGSSIDPKSEAFKYQKNFIKRPIISIGAIINSQPVIYAMPLNDRGEWTGAI